MLRADVLISSFMANPDGDDQTYEYVELMSTEDIDFSETPYTIIFCNNGSIVEPHGWTTGSTLTYAIELKEGKVSRRQSFLVGGPDPRVNGEDSDGISFLNWLVNIDYNTEDGAGGIGLNRQKKFGLIGNGGPAADGIAVFSSLASEISEVTKPQDCIFYGDSIGKSSLYGYMLPDGNLLSDSSSFFKAGKSGRLYKLSGYYDYISDQWIGSRKLVEVKVKSEKDIFSLIQLVPEIFDLSVNENICNNSVSWNANLNDTCEYIVFLSKSDTALVYPDNGLKYSAHLTYGKGDKIKNSNWFAVYSGKEKGCNLSLDSGDYSIMVLPIKENYSYYDSVLISLVRSYQTLNFSVKEDFPQIKDTLSCFFESSDVFLSPSYFGEETDSWHFLGMETTHYECPTEDSIYSNKIYMKDLCGADTSISVNVLFHRKINPSFHKCPIDTSYTIYTIQDSLSFNVPNVDNVSNCSSMVFYLKNENDSLLAHYSIHDSAKVVDVRNFGLGRFTGIFKINNQRGLLYDSCSFQFYVNSEKPRVYCISDTLLESSQDSFMIPEPYIHGGNLKRLDTHGNYLNLIQGDSVVILYVARNDFGLESDTCSYYIKVKDSIKKEKERPVLFCDLHDTIVYVPITDFSAFDIRRPSSPDGKVYGLYSEEDFVNFQNGDSLYVSFVATDSLGFGLNSDTCGYWLFAIDSTIYERTEPYVPQIKCVSDTTIYLTVFGAYMPVWPTSPDGIVERLDHQGDTLTLQDGDSLYLSFVAKDTLGLNNYSDTCGYWVYAKDTTEQVHKIEPYVPQIECVNDTTIYLTVFGATYRPLWPTSPDGKVERLDRQGDELTLQDGDSLYFSFVAKDTLGLNNYSDTCGYWVYAKDTTEQVHKKDPYTPHIECMGDTTIYLSVLSATYRPVWPTSHDGIVERLDHQGDTLTLQDGDSLCFIFVAKDTLGLNNYSDTCGYWVFAKDTMALDPSDKIKPYVPNITCLSDTTLNMTSLTIDYKLQYPTSSDGKVNRLDGNGDVLHLEAGDSALVTFIAEDTIGYGLYSDTCSYWIKTKYTKRPTLLCLNSDTVLVLSVLLEDFYPRWPESPDGEVVRLDPNGELLSLADGDSVQLSFVAIDSFGNRSDTCSYKVIAIDTFAHVLGDNLPIISCLEDTIIVLDSSSCSVVFEPRWPMAQNGEIEMIEGNANPVVLKEGDSFKYSFVAKNNTYTSDVCSYWVKVVDYYEPYFIDCPKDESYRLSSNRNDTILEFKVPRFNAKECDSLIVWCDLYKDEIKQNRVRLGSNEPFHCPIGIGTYRVDYHLSNGDNNIVDDCSRFLYVEKKNTEESDSLPLKIEEENTIGNLLTPNGDGVNDYFVIKNVEKYLDNELFVYDRLGSLVYHSRSYENDWNGTNESRRSLNRRSLLPVGTYFYLFTNENKRVFSGFIELAY